MSDNPLMTWSRLPAFDQIDTAHIAPAVAELLRWAEGEVAALEASPPTDWSALMEPLERITDRVGRMRGLLRQILALRNPPGWREALQEVQPQLVQFSNRLGQSRPLYQAQQQLLAQTEDPARRRILTLAIQSADLAGVGLEDDARAQFNTISRRLTELSTTFSANVLDHGWSLVIEDAAMVEGMPSTWRMMAATRALPEAPHATAAHGPWKVTIDIPLLLPVLKHCADRGIREACRRAWGQRASAPPNDNRPVLKEILALRQQQAALLGFGSYAELSLSEKMAGSVQEVEDMLERLLSIGRPIAVAEQAELEAVAAAAGAPTPLTQWDVIYWAERLQEQRFDLRDEELRPYFPLENVLIGLFSLVERLHGVTIRAADGQAPVWQEDVRFFSITDTDTGEHLANFYLDAYARPGQKQGGAWMYPLCQRSALLAEAGEDVRRPVAILVCNQTPPSDGQPALMSLREVESLFHELGHGLHHMLTEVTHSAIAGTHGVEWDAVEVPSMFLEGWSHQREVLTEMGRHHQTGAPLPEETIDRILASQRFRAASQLVGQIDYALLDLTIHHRLGDDDPFEVAAALRARTRVLPPLPEDRWLCSFLHLFSGGYAAGYYSYLWAEVLSEDALAAFDEAGPAAQAQLGHRYRQTVLALGGSQHPLEVFEAFRGRPPKIDALLRKKFPDQAGLT